MEAYKSRTKVRIVGIFDGILTVALLSQIICCTIYPLWTNYSGHEQTIMPVNGTFPATSTTPIPRYQLMQEAMNSINGIVFNPSTSYKVERVSSFWMWSFLVLVILFGIIPILAAGALVKSTKASLDAEEALQLTRFWMHCNILTFLLAAVEFIVVLLMPVVGFRVSLPLPTLLYVGFRGLFTCIVLKQLNTGNPTLIATLDGDLIEEKV